MIRKSKNNEDKPDFEKMWGEVEEDIQEKDAEQDIISRVPELKGTEWQHRQGYQ